MADQYKNTRPVSSRNLRLSAPKLRENFRKLEEVIGEGHEFTTGGAQTGKHVAPTFKSLSEDPSPPTATNEVKLYNKGGVISYLRTDGENKTENLLAGLADYVEQKVAEAKEEALKEAWPIGSVYTQYPGEDDPATLLGGSWTRLFENEGVFFRTEGGEASSFGSGVQNDQMQRIVGSYGNSRTGDGFEFNVSGAFSIGPSGATNSREGSETGASFEFDSANSPNARASSTTDGETRPKNRTIRVWKKTAH